MESGSSSVACQEIACRTQVIPGHLVSLSPALTFPESLSRAHTPVLKRKHIPLLKDNSQSFPSQVFQAKVESGFSPIPGHHPLASIDEALFFSLCLAARWIWATAMSFCSCTLRRYMCTHTRLAAVTSSLPLVFSFLLLVLGIESRALCMLGKCCTRERHTPALVFCFT